MDDHFWSHPKVSDLSSDAISLWVRAGSYSAQHLTDGFIPEATVSRQLWSSLEAADELVRCGLWSAGVGGFQFHDWLEYQPTAEATLEKREAARERMRAVREKRAARSAERSREQGANDERSSHEVRSTPNPNPNPNPSPNGEAQAPRKRAARLPGDFSITDDMRAWATENVPDLDLDAVLPEFVDYWSAQPGQKGVKADWVATWRNGMRKQVEWRSRSPARGAARQPAMNRALDEYQRLYGGETGAGTGSVRALDAGGGS